ncbi:DEAD/DEAH box helicase family protein [Nocardiopsis salina]|uniref:DEAD/DEAH box helicase family protein n=1 Tax=Nocardiopsis salina TaxID=245836 RepID=UPI00034A9064|nr:DEAD/DEAH box helicase family protein [Nocardiopsis salina]
METMQSAHWPHALRPYQQQALQRVEERWRSGHERTWIVLPPGSGKTLVGLEAARRLGRRTIVLVPNTAIQGQWLSHWRSFRRNDGAPTTAGTGPDLDHEVTVLTYQSLAVFDPEAETDAEGRSTTPVRDRLHPNGRALVRALQEAGPLTLLLDECHHLLQVWGRLIDEILTDLPRARVIGLTGTPATTLTSTEKDLVDRLFGTPVVGASVPALIRQGHLAPFAELAWFTHPTAAEHHYLAEQGTRFTELCTDLLRPGFASTDFLAWIDTRFVHRPTDSGGHLDWSHVAASTPDLAQAVLRLHHAGLCALPRGARTLEHHRRPPTDQDWTALIGAYTRTGLDPDRDQDALRRIRTALPAVGHHLTRNGVRRGTSPVDRVLARSDAKSHATVEILAAEHTHLGERLRALVLCDHERAGSRLPAALREVLAPDSGSARLQVQLLASDPRTRGLHPLLVTGRTVACGPETTEDLLAFARAEHPGLNLSARPDQGLHVIEGSWISRTWTTTLTRFLEQGHSHVLVGTRALLGEGWDARGVNTVVDLTTATTPTAVVQSRGRALRLDPHWPDKCAHTWTVVCLDHDHPRGHADWDRFVRKHDGYLGVDEDGQIMSGIAHIDASLSPYSPPSETDALNARMLTRASQRHRTRQRWNVGAPYQDTLLPTLRVREHRRPPSTAAHAGQDLPAPVAPGAVTTPSGARATEGAPQLLTPATGILAALAVLFVLAGWAAPGWFAGAAVCAAAAGALELRRRHRHAARVLAEAALPVETARYAAALADALHGAGHAPVGAQGVRVHCDTDGIYRFTLTGAGSRAADHFAQGLEEVLAPLVEHPRYIVARHVLTSAPHKAARRAHTWRAALGARVPVTTVHHAVPALLGRNRQGARAFERAWCRWVSDGQVLYTRHGHGQQVWLAHLGSDPVQVSTAHRLMWE